MAFTTYSAFVIALAALSPSGVVRKYAQPPSQLSTADLPAMYVRFPTGAGETEVLTGTASSYSRAACELVVALSPVLQDVNSVNFPATVTMIDSIETVLRAAIVTLGIDTWTIEVQNDMIGDVPYWLVVATVEASG